MATSIQQDHEGVASESDPHASHQSVKSPVSVVIPAFNEEDGIAAQLQEIRRVLESRDWPHEIIVVDDGSGDATAARAEPLCDRVLCQPENRGYGAALKAGIKAAKHELVVIIDADGTYPADAIPALIEQAPRYHMVVGARTGHHVRIPWSRRPAKWFLRVLASYLAGRPIPDLNSGLRVLKKPVIERFAHILPSGFSFTTTITLAVLCNDGFIYYHPIDYYQRVGKSKIRPVDAYHFWLLILRTIIYFNPLKVFVPFGAVLFAAATGKFIYDLHIGNLSESAVMGYLGACIIWAVGLLADQNARIGSGGQLT